MTRVLLVNMPFAGISYPSLALGLFKSSLEEEGVSCDVSYLNLRFAQMVGVESYNVVDRMTAALAGEQMFAESLFGECVPSNEEYIDHVISKLDPSTLPYLLHMKAHAACFLDNCVESIPWQSYDIIGFSSLFEQNVPSLSLAYRIKKMFPEKVIVFGGANCEDVMGVTLSKCFPFVDFVCTGEADLTFPELVKRLAYGHPIDDLPGIVYRSGAASVHTGPPEKLKSLDDLPIPNYDDYFDTLHGTGLSTWVQPQVMVETARGCWWGDKVKCTFCGLNGESILFRAKSVDRAIAEINDLMARYNTGFLRAVDNMMPPHYFDTFLERLAESNDGLTERNAGFDLFYEVRPNLKKREIRDLARVRVNNVQAGIENLCTNILKLMRKGSTSLVNIEFLKWSSQYGVYVDWNMLFGFPGERLADYQRAFELARLVTHLKPPSSVGLVRLDRFSENFNRAEELGFTNVRPWEFFKYVYPFDRETLMDLVYYFDCDREQPIDHRNCMAEIIEHVAHWGSRRDELFAERVNGSVVIHDTRPVAAAPHVVIEGVERDVYEFCDSRRTPQQILTWLREERGTEVSADRLQTLLDGFIRNKLMVTENHKYLSLAVLRYETDTTRVSDPLASIVAGCGSCAGDRPLAPVASAEDRQPARTNAL